MIAITSWSSGHTAFAVTIVVITICGLVFGLRIIKDVASSYVTDRELPEELKEAWMRSEASMKEWRKKEIKRWRKEEQQRPTWTSRLRSRSSPTKKKGAKEPKRKASRPKIRVKSELERKYPLTYSAMGGRVAEARRALDRGVDLFNQGQYEAAIESITEAGEKTPSDETVWAALIPPLLLSAKCTEALQAVKQANSVDRDALGSHLATALHIYHCSPGEFDIVPSELMSKKRLIPVPPVLEVPVNGELIRVEFGMVPKSSRQWWGEGIRMMKRGLPTLARTMFQAAILEYSMFSHAWAGLRTALGALGLSDEANAAEKCSRITRKNEDVTEDLVEAAGLPPREQWIYAITLYRIVYESNLRPLL
jgi:hypothetical protein